MAEPAVCIHHWIIEPSWTAEGGLVGAGCMRCGRTRTFPVSGEAVSRWAPGEDSAVGRKAALSRRGLADEEPEVD